LNMSQVSPKSCSLGWCYWVAVEGGGAEERSSGQWEWVIEGDGRARPLPCTFLLSGHEVSSLLCHLQPTIACGILTRSLMAMASHGLTPLKALSWLSVTFAWGFNIDHLGSNPSSAINHLPLGKWLNICDISYCHYKIEILLQPAS
jgi:hypothetical protein